MSSKLAERYVERFEESYVYNLAGEHSKRICLTKERLTELLDQVATEVREQCANAVEAYMREEEANVQEFRKLHLSMAGEAVERVTAAHVAAQRIRSMEVE